MMIPYRLVWEFASQPMLRHDQVETFVRINDGRKEGMISEGRGTQKASSVHLEYGAAVRLPLDFGAFAQERGKWRSHTVKPDQLSRVNWLRALGAPKTRTACGW